MRLDQTRADLITERQTSSAAFCGGVNLLISTFLTLLSESQAIKEVRDLLQPNLRSVFVQLFVKNVVFKKKKIRSFPFLWSSFFFPSSF